MYHATPMLEHTVCGATLRLPLSPLVPANDVELSLLVDRTPWEVPALWQDAVARPVAQLAADPRRHDGVLTALCDLERAGPGRFVGRVAPVSYFATRALESLLDGTDNLRQTDQPSPGALPCVSASALAHDIGVVVILTLGCGRLLVQRRSPALDFRGGLLSVSASGSLEPGRDFSTPTVGLAGLLSGARRELAEEVGVGAATDPRAHELHTEFLGIWRELARGGKPEVYVSAQTPHTYADVQRLAQTAPDAAESSEMRALSRSEAEALVAGLASGGASLQERGLDLALVAALVLGPLS